MISNSKSARESLKATITARWDEARDPRVIAAADDIAAPFGDAAAGLLYYGSCLRTGVIEDRILDFYVLVTDYRAAYKSRLMAAANGLLPPNVFYRETVLPSGEVVRSKYAVVSVDDFCRRCTGQLLNVSIWARFCQPAVLMRASDPQVRARVAGAMIDAVQTMLKAALVTAGPNAGSAHLWSSAFGLTYNAELRSEPEGKGQEIYELDKPYYDALTRPALVALQVPAEGQGEATRTRHVASEEEIADDRRKWTARRLNGKFVSFMRLVKGAFTFDGGVDYLAWKIRRHSGVEIQVKPWHRRHPIVAGIVIFLPLKLRGGFR